MAKVTLTDVQANYASTSVLNNNFDEIEAAIENTLSRDGTTPNEMEADLDLNHNKLLNVDDGTINSDGVNLGQVVALVAEGLPGSPGGNVESIGLFSQASGMDIGVGTDQVRTSGWNILNVGAAQYVYNAALSASDVASNPLLMFEAADGRVFTLDKKQPLYVEMAGGNNNWVPTANANLGAGTDNYAALMALVNYATFQPEFSTIVIGPDIHFYSGNYYFSQTIDLKKICRFLGTNSGQNNFAGGTRWYFPVNTRGMNINTNFTEGGVRVAVNNGTSEGTTVRGIQFIPMGVGTDATAHGINMQGRANIEYCTFGELRSAATTFHKWPGNAINIVASIGTPIGVNGHLYGNANNWRVYNCYVEQCVGHGLYIAGTDVNAGVSINFETRACGGCGLLDASGLGNTHIGANIAGFANYGLLHGRVSRAGRQYQLIDPTTGVGSSTTPGTNHLVWYDMGADVNGWAAWSGAGTYTPDVPILSFGDSNRSSFISPYVEGGGISHIAPPGVIVSGQVGTTRWSGALQATAISIIRCMFTKTGIGTYQDYTVGGPGYTGNGSYMYTAVGTPDPQGIEYGPTILEHRRASDGETSWYWGWNSAKDQQYRFLNQKNVWRITGPNTTTTFGRTTAVPYIFGVPQLAIIDPNDITQARIMNIRATAPSSGEAAKGERYWMNASNAAGYAEKYCTTAGTIGSTAVLKDCNAIAA